MENLFTHLEQVVLRMDSRFCTEDGHLLKNNVIEAALALDPKLLHYLLADEKLKKQFFSEVDGLLVFDKVKFQRFVMNKQFLPDSYTSFKNKVGLTNENGEFLSESREIVLSWPYKDCMLEGGQTKEDAKRNEIFWNETLAPDEINRLTEPKALCNFRRYDSKGEHEATELRPDDNLIIKGNNLLALYSLRQRFRGKVKLIYIDPPYNTGNDSFGYNDSFNHSTWLTFMKNRLEVAKELLRSDGVIYVQCDDNEQAYLKILLDQIFGRENCINVIVAEMSNMSGNKINNAINGNKFPKIKEYILLYARDKSSAQLVIPKMAKTEWDDEYNLIIPELSQTASKELRKAIEESNKEKANDILNGKRLISLKEYIKSENIAKVDELAWKYENSYRILSSKPNSALLVIAKQQTYNQDVACIQNSSGALKIIKTDFNTQTETARLELLFADDKLSIYMGDIWFKITTTGGVAGEGGVRLSNGKKPEQLLNIIIESATKSNDIVLDFHLGSGTTAAVAHKMNRRYIGCEQLETQLSMIKTRLQNVIDGDQTGCSKLVGWNPQNPGLLDGDKYAHNSFVYCELAQANQQLVDEIMAANEPFKLQEVWALLQEKGFLSYKVSPKMINEHAEYFNDLSLEDQKRFLIECLDKNMLYIPYSDIDDEGFTLSENDKQLTCQFYASR